MLHVGCNAKSESPMVQAQKGHVLSVQLTKLLLPNIQDSIKLALISCWVLTQKSWWTRMVEGLQANSCSPSLECVVPRGYKLVFRLSVAQCYTPVPKKRRCTSN